MKVRLAVLAGLLGAGFFFFLPLARGTALYQDKNGFFSFVPPEGWKMEEIGSGYKTTVKFTPRDDNAAIVLIAELDGDNLGSLYLLKKEYVEDHRARFPQGDFRLSRAAIAGFPALS